MVLQGSPGCPDNYDLIECQSPYDLGRCIELPESDLDHWIGSITYGAGVTDFSTQKAVATFLLLVRFPWNLSLCIVVYDLRTQILNFVAPIPEQVETTTMHFSEVSGGTFFTEIEAIEVIHLLQFAGL